MSPAKHQLMQSRLSKRLRALQLNSFGQYYEQLLHHDRSGEEKLKMINCLTTNKTDFFREGHHFEHLRSTVFPALESQAQKTGERRIRLWSAACSSGEEPYTLAMTVLDHFGPIALKKWDVRILASDVDTDVLAHAERGEYAADRVADLPSSVLKKHFITSSRDPDAPVRVRPELQELVTFRRINFIEEQWPIHTSFDIIFCRNVMIYFDEPTQDKLLLRFSQKLKPDGRLFIGHSESILRLEQLYKPLGNTIYRLHEGAAVSATAVATSPPTTLVSQTAWAATASATVPSGTAGKSTDYSDRVNRSSSRNAVRQKASRTSAGGQHTVAPSPRERQTVLRTRTDSAACPAYPIIVGEIKACSTPSRITTMVGSCIAVCLYDSSARIGGMNHFMLPDGNNDDLVCASYGVHAMELLINEIMRLGGDRRRLQAKVFGGGNVIRGMGRSLDIGGRNAEFAQKFLQTDEIPIVSQDTGADHGRQIHFLTHTGQAFVRPVRKTEELEQISTPARTRREPSKAIAGQFGSIELF